MLVLSTSDVTQEPTERGTGAELRFARLANEVVWLFQAVGGYVRSYKRLKGSVAALACSCPESAFGSIRWDGLFFSAWSSELSQALDWACAPQERVPQVRRAYWTFDSDPLHSIFIDDPLDIRLVKAALPDQASTSELRSCPRSGAVLTHAIAMNLLPWNVPVYWQLILEAYSRVKGDVGTRDQLRHHVHVDELGKQELARLEEECPSLLRAPLSLDVARLGEDSILVQIVPFEITPAHWAELAQLYLDNRYNRSHCVRVVSADDQKLALAVDPHTVKRTYAYLTPTEDEQCALRRLHGELTDPHTAYGALLAQATDDVLPVCGARANGCLQQDCAIIRRALRTQREYLEQLQDVRPHAAAAIAEIARDVSGAVLANWEDVTRRVQDIVAFVERQAEGTIANPIVVHYEVLKSPCSDVPNSTAVYLPILREVDDRAKQIGMPVHLYHLIQPVELLTLIVRNAISPLLHGDKGGLSIVPDV